MPVSLAEYTTGTLSREPGNPDTQPPDMDADEYGLLSGLEDFEIVTKPPYPRLIISAWGADKVGKTSLALSFPAPLFFMNFDYSLHELLRKRPELVGKIAAKSFKITETMIGRDLEPILKEFQAAWERALQKADETGGTAVIDTASQLWQITQDVKVTEVREERIQAVRDRIKNGSYKSKSAEDDALERAMKPSQLDYGRANMFMAALLRKAFHYERANAVFLGKAKPEYATSEGGGYARPTGAWEFNGFGETAGIAQAHLYLFKRPEAGKLAHFAQFRSCREDTSLEGLDIMNPTYESIAGMLGLLS